MEQKEMQEKEELRAASAGEEKERSLLVSNRCGSDMYVSSWNTGGSGGGNRLGPGGGGGDKRREGGGKRKRENQEQHHLKEITLRAPVRCNSTKCL